MVCNEKRQTVPRIRIFEDLGSGQEKEEENMHQERRSSAPKARTLRKPGSGQPGKQVETVEAKEATSEPRKEARAERGRRRKNRDKFPQNAHPREPWFQARQRKQKAENRKKEEPVLRECASIPGGPGSGESSAEAVPIHVLRNNRKQTN